MDFKIGEVAETLGLTNEAIRHYERMGIVRSRRDPENKYRFFDQYDVERLIEMRFCCALGFSIEESRNLLQTPNLDYAEEKLREHKAGLINKIELMRGVIDSIDQMISRMKNPYHHKQIVTMRPEFLRLPAYGKKVDSNMKELRRTWIAAMPLTMISPSFKLGPDDISCERGFCILKEDAERVQLPINEQVQFYPACDCISMFVDYDENDRIPSDIFDSVRQYAERKNLLIEGEIIGRAYGLENRGKIKHLYCEVWIPVKRT